MITHKAIEVLTMSRKTDNPRQYIFTRIAFTESTGFSHRNHRRVGDSSDPYTVLAAGSMWVV